ncbi:shikimate kinase [Modestobacter sp. SYSU DS0875]
MLSVLIGPPAAGKSTAGALLADITDRPFVDADEHAAPSYARVGWSVQRLRRRAAEVGFHAAHREWEVALVAAVVDLVTTHRRAVLALGAGHTHIEDPALFAEVAEALAPVPQVVLLRPAPDAERSWQVLRSRCLLDKGHDWQADGVDWLARWLGDGRDEHLATDVVHTESDAPDVTARRIAALPTRRSRL